MFTTRSSHFPIPVFIRSCPKKNGDFFAVFYISLNPQCGVKYKYDPYCLVLKTRPFSAVSNTSVSPQRNSLSAGLFFREIKSSTLPGAPHEQNELNTGTEANEHGGLKITILTRDKPHGRERSATIIVIKTGELQNDRVSFAKAVGLPQRHP